MNQNEVGEHLDGRAVPSYWDTEIYHLHNQSLELLEFKREVFTPGSRPVVVWKRIA